MPSFAITVQPHPDAQWQIDGWEDNLAEAERRVQQLVTPPQMNFQACILEVGGSARVPIGFPGTPVQGKK